MVIQVRDLDGIAVLHMAHGKVNALDIELCTGLQAKLAECAKEARAVVVTGQGSIFSAGVDLLRVLKEGPEYTRHFVAVLNEFCQQLFTLPMPLVMAVNGHAIAGGCVVACLGDHRLMARGSGRIGVPELAVGVPFPAGPLEVMRWAVFPQYLSEVIYGGGTYEPAAARERGLIDEIVEPEELLDRAVESAARLASFSPSAFRLTKAQMRRPVAERMRKGVESFDRAVQDAWAAPETVAAIRQHVQRTFKKGSA